MRASRAVGLLLAMLTASFRLIGRAQGDARPQVSVKSATDFEVTGTGDHARVARG